MRLSRRASPRWWRRRRRISRTANCRQAYSRAGRAEHLYRHRFEAAASRQALSGGSAVRSPPRRLRRSRRIRPLGDRPVAVPAGVRPSQRPHACRARQPLHRDPAQRRRQSKPGMETMIAGVSPLPAPVRRRSITLGRGTEFAAWTHLDVGLGVDTWYRDPQAPWQEGTVENARGRLRRHRSRKCGTSERRRKSSARRRWRLREWRNNVAAAEVAFRQELTSLPRAQAPCPRHDAADASQKPQDPAVR